MKQPRKKHAKETPPPAVPAKETVPETDEERLARRDRANQAIREILKTENCSLMVPTLDISSGRVYPTIQVVALKAK